MSTAPVRPSRLAVSVSVALAAILFYLISAPAIKYGVPGTWRLDPPTFDPRLPEGREHLARAYAKPYDWLEQHTPLHLLLEPYAQWWFKRLVYY